jgi:hypothetical protein
MLISRTFTCLRTGLMSTLLILKSSWPELDGTEAIKAAWISSLMASANWCRKKILSLYVILPTTLDELQTVARQVVQRYRLMNVKIGPWKPKEYKSNPKAG